MATNFLHEAAVQHENAAKAHLIAAKRCEHDAHAIKHDEPAAQAEQLSDKVESGSAWYHEAALKESDKGRHH
ncbi:MAG: hypothetical protein ABSA13_18900 [Beijerinckiaceae bacterium]